MPENLGAPSWRARLACLLYEALTILAIVIAGVILPYTLLASFVHSVAGGKLLVAHMMLLLLLYFAWQWIRGGQTLAMKTWRIKLVRADDGGPITPALALLRFAAAWVGTLACGIGFLWAVIDRDGQYLHDRLTGTRLISVPKP